MVIHIPHASRQIPGPVRNQFILSDEELRQEQLRMEDAYADELFQFTEASTVIFSYSRLAVDVERFPDDEQESMSRVGMGRFYMKTSDAKPLRRALEPAEVAELDRLYSEHHRKLTDAVERELRDTGECLLIDCHSFPGIPLPCDLDQSLPRPDFCIGTDDFHTPDALVRTAIDCIEKEGFSVEVNRPYSGTLVPLKFHLKDPRVASIMIEANRRLYMEEQTGVKNDAFHEIRLLMHSLLQRMQTEFDHPWNFSREMTQRTRKADIIGIFCGLCVFSRLNSCQSE